MLEISLSCFDGSKVKSLLYPSKATPFDSIFSAPTHRTFVGCRLPRIGLAARRSPRAQLGRERRGDETEQGAPFLKAPARRACAAGRSGRIVLFEEGLEL